MLKLFSRQYGDPQAPAVLLLHGLFGSSTNLSPFARQLESEHFVVLPDLRNHGRSPHHQQMDYPAMAQDVLDLMDTLKIDSASVVGHSMGGKVAMCMALDVPERVERLMAVDIAPVRYEHDFAQILAALNAVDTAKLRDRNEADTAMAEYLSSRVLRQYLLQNLIKTPECWRWRVNLPVIQQAVDTLTGFPDFSPEQFAGDAWFVHGTRSDYVTNDYLPTIRARFPLARIRPVVGAGHWLYAEQPKAFAALLGAFL